MLTPNEIRNITFDKRMRGYSADDVDAFLEQAASELEAVLADKEKTEDKLYVLAEKVEEYRQDEETLKTALINAQKMGENVIHEAKVKADVIIRDATAKAERIMEAADARRQREELALARLQDEVTQFKSQVLELYKAHIELLSQLPEEEPEAESEAETAPEPAVLPQEAPADMPGGIKELAAEELPVFSTFEEVLEDAGEEF